MTSIETDAQTKEMNVTDRTLRGEIRQSLSLILLTAVTAGGVLGLGLLGAHLLG